MGFLDSYKRLEKLCGEVMNDDRRITAYIEAMNNTPMGSLHVSTWNEDLKDFENRVTGEENLKLHETKAFVVRGYTPYLPAWAKEQN